MQPRDLVDGKFKVGLDCCEIDSLRIGARPGEVFVTVWHALGMPDDGCSMVKSAKCATGGPRLRRKPGRAAEVINLREPLRELPRFWEYLGAKATLRAIINEAPEFTVGGRFVRLGDGGLCSQTCCSQCPSGVARAERIRAIATWHKLVRGKPGRAGGGGGKYC